MEMLEQIKAKEHTHTQFKAKHHRKKQLKKRWRSAGSCINSKKK